MTVPVGTTVPVVTAVFAYGAMCQAHLVRVRAGSDATAKLPPVIDVRSEG
jgi:hypothetical protein